MSRGFLEVIASQKFMMVIINGSTTKIGIMTKGTDAIITRRAGQRPDCRRRL
jgi:hypothetical protein